MFRNALLVVVIIIITIIIIIIIITTTVVLLGKVQIFGGKGGVGVTFRAFADCN